MTDKVAFDRDASSGSDDLCLFAHFSLSNTVGEHVFHYLDHIRSCSFGVAFITASKINQSSLNRLTSINVDVIERENRGLDFASWAHGIAKYKQRLKGRLLLANDSVYGPFWPLKRALTKLTADRADWYGMVESLEICSHLQSWFLLFENHVVKSDAFTHFFSGDFEGMQRREIIRLGEIGLSNRLDEFGFKRVSAYSARNLLTLPPAFRRNPSHVLQPDLLERSICPFVKVELLRDNPFGIHLAPVLRAMENTDRRLTKMARAHLATIERRDLRRRSFTKRLARSFLVFFMQVHARANFDGRGWMVRLVDRAAWILAPFVNAARLFLPVSESHDL